MRMISGPFTRGQSECQEFEKQHHLNLQWIVVSELFQKGKLRVAWQHGSDSRVGKWGPGLPSIGALPLQSALLTAVLPVYGVGWRSPGHTLCTPSVFSVQCTSVSLFVLLSM